MDEALTRHLAHLARLELTPEEITSLTAQLGGILTHFETLQLVDVQGVEPYFHDINRGSEPLLREDRVTSVRPSEKILFCAPETSGGGFKVPPIL